MKKKNILIIGAGAVAKIAAHKLIQNADSIGQVNLASRTIEKCLKIEKSIKNRYSHHVNIFNVHHVDASKESDLIHLIQSTCSDIVINLGTPYINQAVLNSCIKTGAAYIDTAVHEDPTDINDVPPWYGNYEWKLKESCKNNAITAILGCGFDPGIVNSYAKYAQLNYFDSIKSIDILDVNIGSHGKYFATNFDPEINLREFTRDVISWQNHQWQYNKTFEVKKNFNFPVVGEQTVYLSGHDEVHSLATHLDVPTIRFWMGFSEHYMNVFNVLKNIGLLSHHPIRMKNGTEIIPIQVIKNLLPDPDSLGPTYQGKTCIGNQIIGDHNGKPRELFIYNVASHENCYQDAESQGIAYTAGVPAVAAALLIANGAWDVKNMVNVEELNPAPFLELTAHLGLNTWIRENNQDILIF